MSEDDDLSFRQHQAANDPSFPARREEAYALIFAALDGVLQPQGYALRGTTWSRTSAMGKSAVHLQRNRYGWDVQVILRFLTPAGEAPEGWDDDELTLDHFSDQPGQDPGRLAFLDVLASTEGLDRMLDYLLNGALPYLDGLHADKS